MQIMSGQIYWKKYNEEKKLPDDKKDQARLTMLRDNAATRFRNAMLALRAQMTETDPIEQQLIDSTLDLYTDPNGIRKNISDAIQAIDPLVEHIRKKNRRKSTPTFCGSCIIRSNRSWRVTMQRKPLKLPNF